MLVFAILAFYVYSPIVAHNISGEKVQAFDPPSDGMPLETIRQQLELTLGRVTNWVPGTDETQKLRNGDSICVALQSELVLITGSRDHTAKIISVHGEATETIYLPGEVCQVAFSPDRDHFAISYEADYFSKEPACDRHECKLFSDSYKRCRTFSFPTDYGIGASTFSADGKWMLNHVLNRCNDGDDWTLLNISSVDNEEKPLVLRGEVLEFSPDNKRIAFVSAGDVVHIIEDMGGKILKQIHPPAGVEGIGNMSFSYDGKLLAINYLKEVQIIDIESGELVKTIEESEEVDFFVSVLFSPNGNYFVTLDKYHADILRKTRLRFWKTSNCIFAFPEKTFDDIDIRDLSEATGIAFDPTGQYLAIGVYKNVCIVDTFSSACRPNSDHTAWKLSYFKEVHEDDITDVAFGYRNAWVRAVLFIEKHVEQQDNE